MRTRKSYPVGRGLWFWLSVVFAVSVLGPEVEPAHAVSVEIVDPSEAEVFHAYDEDEADHSWSVDFTAVGAPAHPDGVYRWYHGYPPGVLRKTGTAAQGGNYYTSTLNGPGSRVVRVTYTLEGETSEPDMCIMWYVHARMELDGAPSSEEYDPGLFIGLDDNNSDEFYGEGDDSLDYVQTGNFGWPLAEDFRGLKFKLDVGYTLWPHDGQFTVRFASGGDSIIRPFEQGQEGWVPVNLGNHQKDATRDWQWLWLQGRGFGTSVIELELPLPGTESAKDRVRLTTVGDLDADVPEDLEQEPPGCVVAYNNDDDDGDGIIDYDDPVNPEEDDRKPISLSLGASCSVGEMRLRAIQGGSNIALWTQPVGGGLELLPVTYDVAELPVMLWVEGVSPGETTLILEHLDSRPMWTLAGDRLLLTVVEVDLDIANVPDGEEENPGGFVGLNDDDDNENGTADKDETGTVTGEDDLVAITVQKVLPDDLTGTVTLSAVAGAAKIKVWESSTKGVEVTLPKTYDTPGDLPKTLYVEGVASSDEQRDVELKLECTQAGTTCSDKVKITVVSVDLSATDLDGAVTEQNEEDPGAYVHYNIDNDNANTQNGDPIADKDEDGPVTDENDLKQASISLQPSLQLGTVILKRSNTKTRVWKSSTKGAAHKVLVDANEKTWDLSDEAQRNDFNAVKDSLWVEGYSDNGASSLAVEYRDPDDNLISCDLVTYTFVGAVCRRQPTPAERSDFGGEGENPFPNLIHCEWSITAEATDTYNCIAWSVGVTTAWYWMNPVDAPRGDGDGILEVSDFDAFYAYKGYQLAGGLSDATIMLYKSASAQAPDNPDGITHAARKRSCSCGAGRWTMYESKCGELQRIEHVHNHLNDDTYGAPFRYYKPQ